MAVNDGDDVLDAIKSLFPDRISRKKHHNSFQMPPNVVSTHPIQLCPPISNIRDIRNLKIACTNTRSIRSIIAHAESKWQAGKTLSQQNSSKFFNRATCINKCYFACCVCPSDVNISIRQYLTPAAENRLILPTTTTTSTMTILPSQF